MGSGHPEGPRGVQGIQRAVRLSGDAQRHRNAHEAGLQRVRHELGRPGIQGHRHGQEGIGPLIFARTVVALLVLTVLGGCSQSPAAPDPPAPVAATPPPAAAPSLSCTTSISVRASTSAGRTVTYPSPDQRGGQGHVSIACAPESGATFPVGATRVECVATDALNRTGSCEFQVAVDPPYRLKRTRIM